MKHIAIIGGAGFIGSELAALLQAKGYHTIIADQKYDVFFIASAAVHSDHCRQMDNRIRSPQ
jgi:nucleoside-diphosphate-sugar epimerase